MSALREAIRDATQRRVMAFARWWRRAPVPARVDPPPAPCQRIHMDVGCTIMFGSRILRIVHIDDDQKGFMVVEDASQSHRRDH